VGQGRGGLILVTGGTFSNNLCEEMQIGGGRIFSHKGKSDGKALKCAFRVWKIRKGSEGRWKISIKE